jgi:hypothetical protein
MATNAQQQAQLDETTLSCIETILYRIESAGETSSIF